MRLAQAASICLLLSFAALSAFGQSNPVPFVNQPLVPSAVAPGGPDFTLTVNGRAVVEKSVDFKTPANLVIADATPERKFVRELTGHENAQKTDAWLKSTPMGFYSIEYAWKKGNKPKRGEFSFDSLPRGAVTLLDRGLQIGSQYVLLRFALGECHQVLTHLLLV